jgi:hypothetical protein
MEKVISEFRVVETDDGFRVEFKGDKEKLRQRFRWAGRAGRGRPRGRGMGFAFGPFPFGMMWGHGRCCCEETEIGEG